MLIVLLVCLYNYVEQDGKMLANVKVQSIPTSAS